MLTLSSTTVLQEVRSLLWWFLSCMASIYVFFLSPLLTFHRSSLGNTSSALSATRYPGSILIFDLGQCLFWCLCNEKTANITDSARIAGESPAPELFMKASIVPCFFPYDRRGRAVGKRQNVPMGFAKTGLMNAFHSLETFLWICVHISELSRNWIPSQAPSLHLMKESLVWRVGIHALVSWYESQNLYKNLVLLHIKAA